MESTWSRRFVSNRMIWIIMLVSIQIRLGLWQNLIFTPLNSKKNKGCTKLLNALQSNKVLTSLNLEGNEIAVAGAKVNPQNKKKNLEGKISSTREIFPFLCWKFPFFVEFTFFVGKLTLFVGKLFFIFFFYLFFILFFFFELGCIPISCCKFLFDFLVTSRKLYWEWRCGCGCEWVR